MTVQSQEAMKLVTALGSYVVLPFLGLMSYFKRRIFPYLATFWVLWVFYGCIFISSGVMPLGPGDIVTQEQRQSWFQQGFIKQAIRVWLTGLLFGIPLLVSAWAFENRRLSAPIKLLVKAIKLGMFPVGVWKFLELLHK
jgi:hypothetical protein